MTIAIFYLVLSVALFASIVADIVISIKQNQPIELTVAHILAGIFTFSVGVLTFLILVSF